MTGWQVVIIAQGVVIVLLTIGHLWCTRVIANILAVQKSIITFNQQTIDTFKVMDEHNKVRDALIVILWQRVGLTREELPSDN